MLPPFDAHGLLPPGDYALTFDQLRSSALVVGPTPSVPNWDASWRSRLVDNLEVLVRQLWTVGVRDIFVDGSFAEDKLTGIQDNFGNDLEFPSAFRASRRDGRQKGIIQLGGAP